MPEAQPEFRSKRPIRCPGTNTQMAPGDLSCSEQPVALSVCPRGGRGERGASTSLTCSRCSRCSRPPCVAPWSHAAPTWGEQLSCSQWGGSPPRGFYANSPFSSYLSPKNFGSENKKAVLPGSPLQPPTTHQGGMRTRRTGENGRGLFSPGLALSCHQEASQAPERAWGDQMAPGGL